MSNLFKQLQEISAEINAAREKAAELGEKGVAAALKEFMEQNPEVRAFAWRQYAPSFNDGDPCVFSVHNPSFLFVGQKQDAEPENEIPDDDEDLDYGTIDSEGAYFYSSQNKKDIVEKAKKYNVTVETIVNCMNLSELLKEMDSIIMQSIFGESSEIIVTKTKVGINDYYAE